jgi:hypothetical protein
MRKERKRRENIVGGKTWDRVYTLEEGRTRDASRAVWSDVIDCHNKNREEGVPDVRRRSIF